jgi:two-component system chemotaxis response regulator CheB
VLFEIRGKRMLGFRCRVGHAYTADSLALGQSEVAENALWVALRALEEKAAFSRRIGGAAIKSAAARWYDQANGYAKHAEVIKKILEGNGKHQLQTVGAEPLSKPRFARQHTRKTTV